MKSKNSYIVPAVILTVLIVLLALVSLLMILSKLTLQNKEPNSSASAPMMAEIYQNGELLQSIPLRADTSDCFVVTGENGCYNEVTLNGASIAITDANCPDKLCVHQGFISTSLLPITCLPNRVVIQVREMSVSDGVDVITY